VAHDGAVISSAVQELSIFRSSDQLMNKLQMEHHRDPLADDHSKPGRLQRAHTGHNQQGRVEPGVRALSVLLGSKSEMSRMKVPPAMSENPRFSIQCEPAMGQVETD
jgi:hypothetical protein